MVNPEPPVAVRLAVEERLRPSVPRAMIVVPLIGAVKAMAPSSASSETSPATSKAPGVRVPVAWVMPRYENTPAWMTPSVRL